MATPSSTLPSGFLRAFERHTEPYPFLVSGEALDPALADNVLAWLESGVEWRLHEGGFYEQWECVLLRAVAPPSCARLLSRDALAGLTRRIGDAFGADLSDRLTVIAHKLLRGQAIGVHNDDPDPGFETHRLVVQLNRRTEQDAGGELRVHFSNRQDDVALSLAPVHNSAFGFAMSPKSFHSVAPMQDWARYTIVFSFWTKAAHAEAIRLAAAASGQVGAVEMAAKLSAEERGRLGQLTGLLQSLGAGSKGHSDGHLIEHLVHTYLILRSWSCSVDLATAGLFHSVYGTGDFHEAIVSAEDRPLLQQVIGERAESVAYHYCACAKASLHECLKSGPPYRVRDLKRNEPVELSEGLFQDLVILDLANEVEQQPRIQEEADVLRERRNLFELAVPFMPDAAVTTLRRTYA
jgi:hypothetical protein